MKKAVAILGTGPAGLMAAHAVALTGRPIVLFGLPDEQGRAKKSVISGAQFIHRAIPTINDDNPDFEIRYVTMGTGAGYQHKVYGDADVPFVSFDRVTNGEVVPAWSLRKTYDRMWESLAGEDGHSVNATTITPWLIREWLDKKHFAAIISTVPKTEVCLAYHGEGNKPHAFVSQSIGVNNYATIAENNEIVYNGDPEYSWYRSSFIDGKGQTEWGGDNFAKAQKMYKDLVVIKKPLHTDCTCWQGKVLFAGRYGEWRKGVLTHEAFVTAALAMEML